MSEIRQLVKAFLPVSHNFLNGLEVCLYDIYISAIFTFLQLLKLVLSHLHLFGDAKKVVQQSCNNSMIYKHSSAFGMITN